MCFVSSSSGIGRNGCPRNSGQATASLSIHPGKAEDPVSDEPHQFLTSGELDVNDLFSTKLQEGACTAHLRGVFTYTGEVEITLLKKNEELASPAFQAELNTYWEPSGETAVLCGTFPPCGHIVKRVPRHSCAADKPFTHSESTLANTDIIYDFSHSGNSINSLFSAIKQTGFGKISPSRIFII